MKKRSLVSAIAMLVVSAIVLTSSTYAWFAASTKADIDNITANVNTTSGSVYLRESATETWKTQLTQANISAVAAYNFPTYLSPCDYDPNGASGAGQWYTGSLAIGETAPFTRTLTANTSAGVPNVAQYFSFFVKVDAAGTVTLDPSITRGSDFVYILIKSGSQEILLANGDGADNYLPFTALTGTGGTTGSAVDSVVDGIISSTEGTAGTITVASTAITCVEAADETLTLTFAAGGDAYAQQVDVVMWAEGQDSNCNGTIAAAQSNVLTFAVDYTAG